MSYGFRSINEDDIVQIDGENLNMQGFSEESFLMGSGLIPSSIPYATAVVLPRDPYKIIMAKYSDTSHWLAAQWNSTGGDEAICVSPTIPDILGTNVDMVGQRADALLLTDPERQVELQTFSYGLTSPDAGEFGMKILNADGDPVYSTARDNLRIIETVPVFTSSFLGDPFIKAPGDLILNYTLTGTYATPPYFGMNQIINWTKRFSSGGNLEFFGLAARCTTTTLSIRLIRGLSFVSGPTAPIDFAAPTTAFRIPIMSQL